MSINYLLGEDTMEEEMQPTICEQIMFGMSQVGDFWFKNSYILNNIIMMVSKIKLNRLSGIKNLRFNENAQCT